MQVCTSHQTDDRASTPLLSFFTGRMPFLSPAAQPTVSKHSIQKSFIQTLYYSQPNFIYLDISISVRDLHEKKFFSSSAICSVQPRVVCLFVSLSCLYGMVNVNLYSTIIMKVSNALNVCLPTAKLYVCLFMVSLTYRCRSNSVIYYYCSYSNPISFLPSLRYDCAFFPIPTLMTMVTAVLPYSPLLCHSILPSVL